MQNDLFTLSFDKDTGLSETDAHLVRQFNAFIQRKADLVGSSVEEQPIGRILGTLWSVGEAAHGFVTVRSMIESLATAFGADIEQIRSVDLSVRQAQRRTGRGELVTAGGLIIPHGIEIRGPTAG